MKERVIAIGQKLAACQQRGAGNELVLVVIQRSGQAVRKNQQQRQKQNNPIQDEMVNAECRSLNAGAFVGVVDYHERDSEFGFPVFGGFFKDRR